MTSSSSSLSSSPSSSSSLSHSVPPFLERYFKDCLSLPDLYSLASLLRIGEREAERVVLKHRESVSGCKLRELLCTKEARELRVEILEILSRYAVTRVGREKIRTLTPTSDREELQRRFYDVRAGMELLQLLGDENIRRVRARLSKVELERVVISRARAPIIAVRDRETEQLVRNYYGDFITVEFVDSADTARELLSRGDCILLVGEQGREQEHEYDEPGIIPRGVDELSEPCKIYPEFVVRRYIARQGVIEALIEILEQFEAIRNSKLFSDANITVTATTGTGTATGTATAAIADLKAAASLIREAKAELEGGTEVAGSFDELLVRYEEEINSEAMRIMRRGGGGDEFRAYLENVLSQMADELMLRGDDRATLWESALEGIEAGAGADAGAGMPFEFAREKIASLRTRYNRDRAERCYYRLVELASQLERYEELVGRATEKLFYLDFLLAVALFSRDFELNIPVLIDGDRRGLGVEMGKNIFLKEEELKGGARVIPVSYSIGEVELGIFGATHHPVAILTGANSGGKTCLLNTLASSVILTELGLPVPAERAEIPLLPLYLYRRKMIKKTGSFEYSLRALSRIFMREGGKVVLIDELEALTEPGAMGRIMASILNNLPEDTLAVVITHLIHEILPHISMEKIRVDGIEPEGLDDSGEIIVDRQPIFNHIGSSMPELVIKKLLGRVRRAELRAVYEEIIRVLEEERAKVSSEMIRK